MPYLVSSMRPAKKHISVRIPAGLEEFLREKSREHSGGLSGIIEDALTIGAIAHGYQPAATSPAFISFAETITGMMIERMKVEGLAVKPEPEK